jgi:hypothetical protein
MKVVTLSHVKHKHPFYMYMRERSNTIVLLLSHKWDKNPFGDVN